MININDDDVMREDYMIRMMIITVKKKNVFYFDIFPFHFCLRCSSLCGGTRDGQLDSIKIECTTDLLVQFLETVLAPATHTAL